ncbi:unnamed protein product [Adineta steineri]|uniref:Uncharacterized protein n=1 Tax=Adineta steineri TaxID=433720 RepID=A0A814J2J2_9BILA|nr:unnamed protein product [Adineta steineri]
MSGLVVINPKSAKILIFDLPNLPTNELNDLIIHCSTINHFVFQIETYKDCILIIVCASNKLLQLATELSTRNFDSLYILNIGGNINGTIENWLSKTTTVYSEKELMRHLCTKIMLCYYSEGIEHKQNGDNGIANTCFLDSIRVLKLAAMFI